MICLMQSLCLIVNLLPKLQRNLEAAIKEIPPGDLKNKIKPLSETCWQEKPNAFDDLKFLYCNQ